MAILDLIERFTPSEIEVYRLNRRKEKVFGSDFDIWFKYSGKWVGYRLQAKLCDPSGKFRVNPKQHATLTGGTAEGIPPVSYTHL
ncbi:MAG: hypothetical protein N2545_05695, partial [Thermoflexales bacterium]|nr:hypothetical protein [Thermoflexales bacterium]